MYGFGAFLEQGADGSLENLIRWYLTSRITPPPDSKITWNEERIPDYSRHFELEYEFETNDKPNELKLNIPKKYYDSMGWKYNGKTSMAHYSELAKMIVIDFTEAIVNRLHIIFAQEHPIHPVSKDFIIKANIDILEPKNDNQ